MRGYRISVDMTGSKLKVTVSMGEAQYTITDESLAFDDAIPPDEASADLKFLSDHLEKLAGFVRLVADGIWSQRN